MTPSLEPIACHSRAGLDLICSLVSAPMLSYWNFSIIEETSLDASELADLFLSRPIIIAPPACLKARRYSRVGCLVALILIILLLIRF